MSRWTICLLIAICPAVIASAQKTERIHAHLEAICASPARNYQNILRLNEVADYIRNHFQESGGRVEIQSYQVGEETYKNIIGSFGPEKGPRIIVGAHYDVAGDQAGADDNASGVVGLLELASLMRDKPPGVRIDLVAYSLEEPPFFRTQNMGSYRHVSQLKSDSVEVIGMVCLEMIGYFDDAKNSQAFPLGFLRLFYGSRGNFISTIRKFGEGKFSRKFHRRFKKTCAVRVKSLKGPQWLPGVDFSDHMWFWEADYSALMITDTSFYRNHHYHEDTDTIETLDMERMAQVINSVGEVLVNW